MARGSIGRGPVVVLGLLLLGCAQPAARPEEETPAMAVNVSNAKDLTAHDGQVVTAIGRYEDMGRYRYTSTLKDGTQVTSNQIVYLKLDDGTDVRLGARPETERAQFQNQRVTVRGRLIANPPRQPDYMAQMDPAPTIVEIDAVTAAP